MTSSDRDTSVILIAERDQNVRKLQRIFLSRAGYDVAFSDDGRDAFERAVLTRPALVITEILLPKLDGLALCRHLREDPRTRDIPVMVFSILAAARRAGEAGATAFLRKPLVDRTFVAAVQDVIAAQPIGAVEEQWAAK
jgi:CheY-like chemotaxis protein